MTGHNEETCGPTPRRWLDGPAPALLLACIAALIATDLMWDYLTDPGALWRDVQHDRNTHLAFAMDLAQRLRDWDAPGWLERLARSTVWPPLHGVLLSLILVLSGGGHRAAILPSLLGWGTTVVCCGVLAGRLAGPRRAGRLLAGGVAALFAATSPALRLLGSDVMLEALGSALSAAALLAWMRCAEGPTRPGRWRLLAVILTLLFLEKYNYWALMVVALALAAGTTIRRHWWVVARSAGRTLQLRQLLLDPLLLLFVGLAAIVVTVLFRGPTTLEAFGRSFALYPPGHLLSLAYGLLLLRVALWWRAARAELAPVLGPAGLALLRWHLLPVALWLLVPYALQHLIWFLGGNYVTVAGYDPWRNLAFQAEGFGLGFHVAPWAGTLAIGLAMAGLLRESRRDAQKGAAAVAVFLLLSMGIVVLHPQQQWRFQATSLFALWALAGAGAAHLSRGRLFRGWGGGALFALLGIALAVQPVSPVAKRVAIRPDQGPSDLELAKAYGGFIVADQPVGFVSRLGRNDFFDWTVRERCRCSIAADQPYTFEDRSRAAVMTTTSAWLSATPSHRIIAVDAAPRFDNPAIGLTWNQQRGQLDALAAQSRFRLADIVRVPEFPATVSLWTDTGAAPLAPRRRFLIEWTMLALATLVLAVLLARRTSAGAEREENRRARKPP
ncbi:MAG: hypothetical protein NVSMB18_11230 [Acetobacteraceae bacterium]